MNRNRGFIALINMAIFASVTLTFSFLALSSALTFSDFVQRKEYRLQAKNNAYACLNSVKLLAYKYYYLAGNLEIREFGCYANITNDGQGNVNVDILSVFNQVSFRLKEHFSNFTKF